MKKAMTLIAALALMMTTFASVQATTLNCSVVKVEGTMVTMDCGDKAADLTTGAKVKVKTEKAKTAIEGC
ncbi:MAG: hypothetical protein KJ804_03230 [Proteobacteria bacterium]|nr:hypothetical protein [Pseudomonadota bacterium]MBU1057317.1 hypothetical protein [Pseudomonadota bacterium]